MPSSKQNSTPRALGLTPEWVTRVPGPPGGRHTCPLRGARPSAPGRLATPTWVWICPAHPVPSPPTAGPAWNAYLGLDLAPLLFGELTATPLLQLLQDAAVDGQAAVHLGEELIDVCAVGAEQALADLCELSTRAHCEPHSAAPWRPHHPPPAALTLASPESMGGDFRKGHLLVGLAWWQGARW